jgi:hypothetical protein
MTTGEKATRAQTGDGVFTPPANPGQHAHGMATPRHSGRIALEDIYAMLLDPPTGHAERRSEQDAVSVSAVLPGPEESR